MKIRQKVSKMHCEKHPSSIMSLQNSLYRSKYGGFRNNSYFSFSDTAKAEMGKY